MYAGASVAVAVAVAVAVGEVGGVVIAESMAADDSDEVHMVTRKQMRTSHHDRSWDQRLQRNYP